MGWGIKRGFTVSITTMSAAPWLQRLMQGSITGSLRCASPHGSGGTNAITGVVGMAGFHFPCWYCRGQVRYDTTARWSGWASAPWGDQEFDICKAIDCMTKYSEMVIDPMRIRYCLEKAFIWPGPGVRPLLAGYSPECPGAFVETEALPVLTRLTTRPEETAGPERTGTQDTGGRGGKGRTAPGTAWKGGSFHRRDHYR